MTSPSEELMKTFEDLAVRQRSQADRIETMAAAQGMPLGDLQITVNYLREKAAECDRYAEAIRNGDAGSLEDPEFVSGGGIQVFDPDDRPWEH